MRRGWGEWGGAPYTDLMAAVDAAEQRPDIDASRTAAMGGSFGGYMANWVATQTDRFRGDRDPRQPVGPRRVHRHDRRGLLLGEGVGRPAAPSPSATSRTRRTATPTRSARRCWSSTATRTTGCRSARRCGSGTTCRSAAVPSKFLYFPDENHWVLTPGQRDGLVRDGARLPRRARAGRGVAAARAALRRRRARQARGRRRRRASTMQRAQLGRAAGRRPAPSAEQPGEAGRSGSLASARSSATLAMAPSPRSQALTASRVAGAASSGAGARRVHSVHSDSAAAVRRRAPARARGRAPVDVAETPDEAGHLPGRTAPVRRAGTVDRRGCTAVHDSSAHGVRSRPAAAARPPRLATPTASHVPAMPRRAGRVARSARRGPRGSSATTRPVAIGGRLQLAGARRAAACRARAGSRPTGSRRTTSGRARTSSASRDRDAGRRAGRGSASCTRPRCGRSGHRGLVRRLGDHQDQDRARAVRAHAPARAPRPSGRRARAAGCRRGRSARPGRRCGPRRLTSTTDSRGRKPSRCGRAAAISPGSTRRDRYGGSSSAPAGACIHARQPCGAAAPAVEPGASICGRPRPCGRRRVSSGEPAVPGWLVSPERPPGPGRPARAAPAKAAGSGAGARRGLRDRQGGEQAEAVAVLEDADEGGHGGLRAVGLGDGRREPSARGNRHRGRAPGSARRSTVAVPNCGEADLGLRATLDRGGEQVDQARWSGRLAAGSRR